MKNTILTRFAVVAAIVVLGLILGTGGIAQAGEGEQSAEKVKKVKVKVIKLGEGEECEGEDCPKAEHHRIIIKKDGDLHKVHEMMGEDCDEECIEAMLAKHGVDMSEIHAMAGHHMEMSDEDCDHDDCKKAHRIIIKKDGDLHKVHEMMGEDCDEECIEAMLAKHGVDMSKVHTMAGEGLEWVDEECEGDDCKKMHHIIMKRHGDAVAGGHGFALFSDEDGRKGGFLGVQLTDLTSELRTHFGAPSDQGVMVGKVLAGSAAEGAALQVGDIVTTVDDQPVGSAVELSGAIGKLDPGASVDLGIWRQGTEQKVTATLGKRASAAKKSMRKIVIVCEDGDEDCEADVASDWMEFDCGGAEDCDVNVECKDDECTCTVNGEPMDCKELHGSHRSDR